MLTQIPTPRDVVEALRGAVEERGADYVYVNPQGQTAGVRDDLDNLPSCFYVHGTAPGCIAGTALVRLGVPLQNLLDFEGSMASEAVEGTIPLIVEDFPTSYGAKGYAAQDKINIVSRILVAAQTVQDAGGTWGEALTAAEQVALANSPA